MLQTYWKMIRKEGQRRHKPILLAELRRLVDPTYSTDWSIFIQLTANCTLEDYVWGYRNYLEGSLDTFLCFVFLILIGIQGGLQGLFIDFSVTRHILFFFSDLNLGLLGGGLICAFHIVLRDFRRRYDWAQLWQKVTANHQECREN